MRTDAPTGLPAEEAILVLERRLADLDTRREEVASLLAALTGARGGRGIGPGPGRVLSDERARQLLTLRGRCSQREAGKRFGISRSLVSEIWAGTRYQHLTRGEG